MFRPDARLDGNQAWREYRVIRHPAQCPSGIAPLYYSHGSEFDVETV
jgi:hypothetical protein